MEGKKKLKILILSWRGLGHPNAGGAEISTHEHAKGWVRAGHQVTLFTASYLDAPKEEVIDGVRIKRCGKEFLQVHWEAFKWYVFGKHEKFDLVIDQFHGIPFLTPLYVKAQKLAFIHEVAKEVWWVNFYPRPFNFFVAMLGSLIEPLIFKLYKDIPFMTVSDSTKKDLISWGIPKNDISIIHNGITMSKLKIMPRKEKVKTLVFLGALSEDKGIEEALKTFEYLQNNFANKIQFWVIGRGEEKYTRLLKVKAQNLKLKNLRFFGYVNEKEKFDLLSRAHILINPSIREGWGLVVIEAASVGTPTIGYDVAGLRDSILNGKTGILCSKNPNDLARSVLFLLNNKEYYQTLQRNCLKWSKKFRWDKSVHLSLKLIENL